MMNFHNCGERVTLCSQTKYILRKSLSWYFLVSNKSLFQLYVDFFDFIWRLGPKKNVKWSILRVVDAEK